MKRTAILSPCGTYRFTLGREEEPLISKAKGTVVFALLNPSTANADVDDQTVRKGWSYTRAWGYFRMVFVNTNPFRSTDPNSSLIPPELVLRENDKHLKAAATKASLIICAWGTKVDPQLAARAIRVLGAKKHLHYLELSNNGTPKHPLYLKGNLQPILWRVTSRGTV